MDLSTLIGTVSYICVAIITFAATFGKAENCYQCTHPITFEIMTGMKEACSDKYASADYSKNPVYCANGCRVTRTLDAGLMTATIQRGCATAERSKYFTIEGKALNFNISCFGNYCNKQKYELVILISLVVICLTSVLQFVYSIFLKILHLVLFLVVSLLVIFSLFYYFV